MAAQNKEYDVVLASGRVIDPETKLDAVRHVGINGVPLLPFPKRP